jgi:hypothetical protein
MTDLLLLFIENVCCRVLEWAARYRESYAGACSRSIVEEMHALITRKAPR